MCKIAISSRCDFKKGKTIMNITQKKIWVKELLVDCPYDIPLANCILRSLRNESMNSRLIKINLMNNSELDSIISHHKKCLAIREKE